MHRATPFQALELRLSDGQVVEVKHPESLAISPRGHLAVVFTGNESALHIDVSSIVEVKTKGAGAPAARRQKQ